MYSSGDFSEILVSYYENVTFSNPAPLWCISVL